MTEQKPVVKELSSLTAVGPNAKLSARLIYACPRCQAPGVYSKEMSIQKGWPKCYDPERDQQPVGDTCPNCGCSRAGDQDLGVLGIDYQWPFIVRLMVGIGRRLGLIPIPQLPKELEP